MMEPFPQYYVKARKTESLERKKAVWITCGATDARGEKGALLAAKWAADSS